MCRPCRMMISTWPTSASGAAAPGDGPGKQPRAAGSVNRSGPSSRPEFAGSRPGRAHSPGPAPTARDGLAASGACAAVGGAEPRHDTAPAAAVANTRASPVLLLLQRPVTVTPRLVSGPRRHRWLRPGVGPAERHRCRYVAPTQPHGSRYAAAAEPLGNGWATVTKALTACGPASDWGPGFCWPI